MQSKADRVICGNCKYWIGKRRILTNKSGEIKIHIIDKCGLCRYFKSEEGVIKKKDSRCKHFGKLTELL